jgi:hypothetical protein
MHKIFIVYATITGELNIILKFLLQQLVIVISISIIIINSITIIIVVSGTTAL